MVQMIRDTKVAVVGGAGFLGSHLVHYLTQERNCHVVVIDNLVCGSKSFLPPKTTFVHADITLSETYLASVFYTFGIEYVFNYVAYPYIPDSFARPIHVFNVNAVGALNVINAAHSQSVKGILQVSSAEIYGDGIGTKVDLNSAEENRDDRIDEECMVRPHSSYGSSKAAIDFMIQARWREARTPCISLRQFNCLGERNYYHPYVIPEIYRQIKRYQKTHETLTVNGKPQVPVYLGNNSRRDFLYAGDQAVMAVELLENGKFGEVYNLGSEHSVSIYELAKMIGEVMGVDVDVIPEERRMRPWEIWNLRSSNNKIYSVISHRPKVGLEEALVRTIQSFEEAEENNLWGWRQTETLF